MGGISPTLLFHLNPEAAPVPSLSAVEDSGSESVKSFKEETHIDLWIRRQTSRPTAKSGVRRGGFSFGQGLIGLDNNQVKKRGLQLDCTFKDHVCVHIIIFKNREKGSGLTKVGHIFSCQDFTFGQEKESVSGNISYILMQLISYL